MLTSVIIPTYGRAEILRRTLQAYSRQSGEHQILEILVVDDGSKDHTSAVVEECCRSSNLKIVYLPQENRGLAAARNRAIREAHGDLLLFGDDDIIPDPSMTAEHVSWHLKHPEPSVGVLGYVTWAPEVRPTPFMVWSGLRGPQFNFGNFSPGGEIEFRYGYFCNTSVKSAFLREHGVFNENLRRYGWEDLELSYRLVAKGYRLLYNPAAVGYHYKFESFENTRLRIENLYRAWPVFAQTEAGQRFLELWREDKRRPAGLTRATLRKLLKPLKSAAMAAFKPFVDTRLPLPDRLYDMVFYHYVTPFSSFISAEGEATEILEAQIDNRAALSPTVAP